MPVSLAANVAYGSDSDLRPRLSYVGSSLNSGPTVTAVACRFRAMNGSRRTNKKPPEGSSSIQT
jgi:hypothetical protein